MSSHCPFCVQMPAAHKTVQVWDNIEKLGLSNLKINKVLGFWKIGDILILCWSNVLLLHKMNVMFSSQLLAWTWYADNIICNDNFCWSIKMQKRSIFTSSLRHLDSTVWNLCRKFYCFKCLTDTFVIAFSQPWNIHLVGGMD